VTALRDLDGPDLHTPVVMAVRGPKAQALAAEVADTVTFALMPGEPRAKVARLVRDFRAIRDVELALHVPVIGDTGRAAYGTPPTPTLPRFERRTRWRYFRMTQQRPPRRFSGDERRPASRTLSSAQTSPTHSLRSSRSWPDIKPEPQRWQDLRQAAAATPSPRLSLTPAQIRRDRALEVVPNRRPANTSEHVCARSVLIAQAKEVKSPEGVVVDDRYDHPGLPRG
jgi:hypothetical protein